MHRKTIAIFCLALAMLMASLVSIARPIRGASAASSEEFPASDLPYDAQVEWLQGDGRGAYIDTGVSLYDGDIEVLFAFGSYKEDGGAFGYTVFGNWKGQSVSGLTAGLACLAYRNTIRLRYNYFNEVMCPFDTLPHTISTKNNRIFFDGLDTGRSGKVTRYNNEVIQPIFLFCECQNGNDFHYSYAKIYSFSCGDILDLIPVRFTNEEGLTEGALYDRISGELFRNSGTGSFLLGPDL